MLAFHTTFSVCKEKGDKRMIIFVFVGLQQEMSLASRWPYCSTKHTMLFVMATMRASTSVSRSRAGIQPYSNKWIEK